MHTLTIRGMRIALDRAGLYSVSAVVDWLKTGCNELKFFHYGECAEVGVQHCVRVAPVGFRDLFGQAELLMYSRHS